MKTSAISIFTIVALLCLTWSSCKDDDDNFCIDNISMMGQAQVSDVTITLPNGESYTGTGALPFNATLGDYEGQMSSVITKQTETQTGLDVELVHYFNDGDGNIFWTNDQAVMTPVDATLTVFTVYDEMTVVGGTGDFECALGLLINNGEVNFVTGELDFNVTGNVCGGCD